MRNNSITYKILFVIIILFFITSITALYVIDYKLSIISDKSQKERYIEKIDLIISRLESYQKRLSKTGIEDIYIADFQQLSLSRLKENYYKDNPQKVYPTIINNEGKILLSNDNNIGNMLYKVTNKFSAAKPLNTYNRYFNYMGKKYWAIYKYFPEWKWHIAYIMPLNIKYANVKKIRDNLAIIMIISTVITIILLILTLTRIIKPIIHLTNVADKIANGNLKQSIDVNTNDEVGRLAHAFDKMRLSIIEQITQLHSEVIERKQAEENLLITLNSIGDAVISTDNLGRIVHMNPIALKLTGWTLDDAANKPLLEVFNIINSRTREQCISPVTRILNTGSVVNIDSNTLLISKTNIEYNIADSAAPIRDENNNVIGVVLVFRDVTERYKLESQLRQSDKMQAVGQLAGGVAHDFNNMLGGIIGATEILHNYLDGSKQAEELYSIIINASDRAAELTQQLLAFARKKKIGSTTINLHEIIEDSVSLLKRTIDKSIAIKCAFNADTDAIIGDPSQLQNILINLGINASHAMPEGGVLSFSSKNIFLDEQYCSSSNFDLTPGDYIEIEITDTGCGIPPEHIDRIFEPFFTTKTNGKGTGLGLSAVYGSVIQHHGAIRINSQLQKYTTFYLLFPNTNEDNNNKTTMENSYQTGEGTILVIDDEQLMRTTAEAILNNAGYSVILAENGKIGLEKYIQYKESVDLVILDMIMPVMNGKECFNGIKDIAPDAKIILASGFTKDEDIERMKQKNLCAFISKPYRSSELINLIASILNDQTNF